MFNVFLAAFFSITLGLTVLGQTQPGAEAPQESGQSPVDQAFRTLGRDFKNLYESLRNKGGVAEQDRSIISSLRDRAAEFSRQFPGDLRGPALELTLSTWLKEDELVEKLYADMLQRAPDNAQVRIGWAERLKSQNRYAQAIEVLQDGALDPAVHPQAFVTLSDCLFAENRFDESLEALRSIPASALEDRIEIKFQVDQNLKTREEYVGLWAVEQSLRQQEETADELPRVLLTTARGTITLELFENQAPNTVANFISLVEQGFYATTKFHRVIANFMSQGGDPNTKPGATGIPGQGNPGYYIPDEVGREDHRKHFGGSLAMAKQEIPNTAGCQFFINHAPASHLNGKHTVFGRVLEGLDVARAIKQDDVIESITVLRKREHPYTPSTLPLPGATTRPATAPATTAPAATAPHASTRPVDLLRDKAIQDE